MFFAVNSKMTSWSLVVNFHLCFANVFKLMYNQRQRFIISGKVKPMMTIPFLVKRTSLITFPGFPSQAYRFPSSPKLQSENLSLYFSCRH